MRIFIIILIILNPFPETGISQVRDSVLLQGQLSGWLNINPENTLPVWFGGRYIPQLNYELTGTRQHKIDFEASAHISGSMGINPFSEAESEGYVKPYRLWTRYSGSQFELRLGLQKINFGSASMLRPLMWFDQVDPRDPLQLTDGVWGLMGRYYFLNNMNIWLWGLYGNKGPKTWENGETTEKKPEYGGRLQIPVPRGEAALSFHHRKADITAVLPSRPDGGNIPENRIGFDTKVDLKAGIWAEAVWIHKHQDVGILTNQQIFNLGIDYTFGVGNGLHVIFEQLFVSTDKKAFEFKNNAFFSGTTISYPVGILDNISTIVYYDWTNNNLYNFINWQRQLNRLTFYLMAFWNPPTYQLPQQEESGQLFAGKGVQLMLVFNH